MFQGFPEVMDMDQLLFNINKEPNKLKNHHVGQYHWGRGAPCFPFWNHRLRFSFLLWAAPGSGCPGEYFPVLGCRCAPHSSIPPRFCLFLLLSADLTQECLSLSDGRSGFALCLLFKSNYLLRVLLLASAFLSQTQQLYKTWFFLCLWNFWGICIFLS